MTKGMILGSIPGQSTQRNLRELMVDWSMAPDFLNLSFSKMVIILISLFNYWLQLNVRVLDKTRKVH